MFSTNNLEQFMQKVDEHGWAVLPIAETYWKQLLKHFMELENANLFSSAQVTPEYETTVLSSSKIRNDQTCWLESENILLTPLHQLRENLKQYFRISLQNIECHFAKYPTGHFYKRHIDQTIEHNQRFFSFIIYLNPVWAAKDAGRLLAYDQNNLQIFNLLPLAGQMIVFKSDIPHEVEVCFKDRRSLAGWMRT